MGNKYIILTVIGANRIGIDHFDLNRNKVYLVRGYGEMGAIGVLNDCGNLQTLLPDCYRFVTVE